MFMKLVEEIGEVAEALNKSDGRKADDGKVLLLKSLQMSFTIQLPLQR